MRKRLLSAGVKALNLPPQALDVMEKRAIDSKPNGKPFGKKGIFYYVPMACITPTMDAVTIVVSVFLKPLRQDNIHAQRGDIAFALQTEWNQHENPLD